MDQSIKIIAEFGNNKIQGEFEDFDEVYDWLATVKLLHKEKKQTQCVGFVGKIDEEETETKTDDLPELS